VKEGAALSGEWGGPGVDRVVGRERWRRGKAEG